MPVVVTLSNHYKYQRDIGAINLAGDTLKIILMNTTFAFNPDSHATLADVTADQLATGFGYTQDNKTLAGAAVTENDTDNRSDFACSDVTWTATGGAIGPAGAAIIYDDTTSDDTVVMCIDFGTDLTATDGVGLQVMDITIQSS